MKQKLDKTYDELKKNEAEFFDQSIRKRTSGGNISESADIRRANRVIANGVNEPIDPKVSEILFGDYRKKYIDFVSHKKYGRVLELCCGPGWLALELGRRGQNVDAYDISSESINVAKKMLKENPYKDGFGSINYYLEDISQCELGREKYDAVSCWASWYYLSKFDVLLDRVWSTLKVGGIFAIEDDRAPRSFEKYIARILSIVLPTCDKTYLQKIISFFKRINNTVLKQTVSTNQEPPSAKTMNDIPENTDEIFKDRFEVLMDVHFNAFAIGTMRRLRGPDFIRYGVDNILAYFDRLLCRKNICKGQNRIIIVCKKT